VLQIQFDLVEITWKGGNDMATKINSNTNGSLEEALAKIAEDFLADPPLRFKIMRSLAEQPPAPEKIRELMKLNMLHSTAWVRNFPRWMGFIYGNCPIPIVRRHLLDNMVDEDSIDKRAGDCHVGLHRRLCLALGLTDEELDGYEKQPILPEVKMMIHAIYELVRTRSWQEGVAAIGISEMTTISPSKIKKELQPQKGFVQLATEALTQLGLSREDLAFLWVHEAADVGHARTTLIMLEKNSPTVEIRERVIEAARTGIEFYRAYHDAVGRELQRLL